MNAISQARLTAVCPGLAAHIARMEEMLPFDFEVTQGLRTWVEQDVLYAQGRTSPGPIVTFAAGGHSWHCFGLAVDLVPEDIAPGQPDWNLDHPVWQRMVSVAESLGLVSGSEWTGIEKDTPHVQLTGKFPASPNDAVRAIFLRNGKIEDVWAAAF